MSKKKTILVVEDEPDMIQVVERKLVDRGFNVLVAQNGQQALDAFQSAQVNLVLIDVVLPDIDGFEVCRRIKEQLSPETIVLVYTGKLEKVDVVMARQSHADEMVVKSGNLDTTVEKIEELLRSSDS